MSSPVSWYPGGLSGERVRRCLVCTEEAEEEDDEGATI